jgi:prevent-host-death family protein
MRTLSADNDRIKVRELIESARDEPVTVLHNGELAVVVLSPADFERLAEQERMRQEAKARLRRTLSAMQKDAADRGLTDKELDRLLADES